MNDLPPSDRHPSTALVAEDDADLMELAAAILRGAGLAVRTAPDGLAALRCWREDGPVDVVFTDLVMPGLDGLAVATALWAERPDLPVVFTTGHADPRLLAGVAATGCPLVPKPYTAPQLQAVIASALDRSPRSEVAR